VEADDSLGEALRKHENEGLLCTSQLLLFVVLLNQWPLAKGMKMRPLGGNDWTRLLSLPRQITLHSVI
jgi:hypothetical protein